MLSLDKRLPLDTWHTSGLQENVFGNQFSTYDWLRNPSQEIHSCTTPRETESVQQAIGTRTSFTREDKQNQGTIPMPTFARRLSTTSSLIPVAFPAEFCGWTAEPANIGAAIREVPYTFLILMLEDKIQNSSDYLF